MDLGRVGIWTAVLDALPSAQARDVAAEIEALGYGALWIPDTLGRDSFVHAAFLLDATERLPVATGIASIQGRDPMAMHAAWQTVSEAFPDRFLLGLGVSHAALVEGLRGGTYERPYTKMRDYLDRMDGALFLGAGPSSPPERVLAALGPRMLALAAERAAGAHTYFVPVEHTATAREHLGPGKLLAPEVAVVLERDAARAREIARGYLALYLDLPNYTNNLRRLGFDDDDLAAPGSDRLVDALVAWGDVDAIRARAAAHLAAGADHVAVQVLTDPPFRLCLDEWRTLAPVLVAA